MKETGIMFTPPNIRLILDDLKWESRRVGKFEPRSHNGGELYEVTHVHGDVFDCHYKDANGPDNPRYVRCPYGRAGDKLYIKEGVIIDADFNPPELIGYYMDGARAVTRGEKRLTAMFMPKWAARTWLEITNVRVQRVQEISETDCVAEGCPKDYLLGRNWYKNLWDEINGKKHPWASNPFCWCLTFRRVRARKI